MSQELIPHNPEKAAALEEKLSQSFYRSPREFIKVYNAGIVNRSNDDVRNILERILETYKGIEKRGNEITFLTVTEIAIEEILVAASAYRAVLQIKRILRDAIAEEHINEGSVVTVTKNGAVFVPGEESTEELPGVRHGSLSAEVTAKLRTLLGVDANEAEYKVVVSDVLSVDESPVSEAAAHLHL